MSGPTLFTLRIPSTSGKLVLTLPAPDTYLLTFGSPPDNRLTTEFLQIFLHALDLLEVRYLKPNGYKGVLVTTSAIPKFYSNGLDLKAAQTTPGFWEKCLYTFWKRLLL
jgi:hypothetical protein